MKVIFLQDVARTGRKHEIKDVPDGHAKNYLIPRKLAAPATALNLKRQSEHTARTEAKATEAASAFAAYFGKGETPSIVMTAPANKEGHLFKGLRAADVAAALSSEAGIEVSPAAIGLAQPIKETGEHRVSVVVAGEERSVIIIVNPAQP